MKDYIKLGGLIAILAIVTTGALWQVSKAHCFQLVGDDTCRVETKQKFVALSFDDGPTPQGVDAVLNTLDRHQVKATFFLIGDRMARYPGQARRLRAAGHELGNHSFTHKWMIGKSAAHYDAEIAKTDALLKAEGMAAPLLFRPPFGKKLVGLPLAIERAGYQSIMWDVEDDLTGAVSAREYADHIVSAAKPGSIILMHPMYRSNQTARDALPIVIEGLRARGFQIVPVGTLLRLHSGR